MSKIDINLDQIFILVVQGHFPYFENWSQWWTRQIWKRFNKLRKTYNSMSFLSSKKKRNFSMDLTLSQVEEKPSRKLFFFFFLRNFKCSRKVSLVSAFNILIYLFPKAKLIGAGKYLYERAPKVFFFWPWQLKARTADRFFFSFLKM